MNYSRSLVSGQISMRNYSENMGTVVKIWELKGKVGNRISYN